MRPKGLMNANNASSIITFGLNKQKEPSVVSTMLTSRNRKRNMMTSSLLLLKNRYMILLAVVCIIVFLLCRTRVTLLTTTTKDDDDDDEVDLYVNHSLMFQDATNSTGTYAIFYNAYINPNSIDHSLGIVVEQLAAWQSSRHANATLYYTHLGDASKPFPCPHHGRCKLLYRGLRGKETITLRNIYEYCQQHPENTVIYLHSKGSFHSNEENDRLRKVLTKSALSDQCHHGLSNTHCNICSARFSPVPHWHTPGNMWTAQCSYIRKLYPVLDFGVRVAEVVRQFTPNLTNQPDWSLGLDRYSDEHWVYTHPHVYPCDVYPDLKWIYGYVVSDIDLPLELYEKVPRNYTIPKSNALVNPPAPQFRLSYRLYELQELYNAIPANDSFVWTWYQQANFL